MEKMTREQALEYAKAMEQAESITENQIDMLYATGKLNNIILGAVRTTLFNLNYDMTQIKEALYECEHGTFDQYTAYDLRQAKTLDK